MDDKMPKINMGLTGFSGVKRPSTKSDLVFAPKNKKVEPEQKQSGEEFGGT